jgi:hypothetical protein
MIIIEKKIIFIHPGKSGGTTIEKHLNNFFEYQNIGKRNLSENNQYKRTHASLSEISLLIDINDYFKFTIVRNPISRLWSLYNFSFKNKKKLDPIYASKYSINNEPDIDLFLKLINDKHELWKKIKNNFIDLTTVEFDMLITYGNIDKLDTEIIKDINDYKKNWIKSQYSQNLDKNNFFNIDKIIKLENFDDDFKFIIRKYNLKNNIKKHQVNQNEEYQNFDIFNIDIKYKKMIYKMFELDFIKFDYQFR